MPSFVETKIAEAEEDKSVFLFPATLAQRRFWLLDQLQPGGNPALHMAIALRLRGPLDPSLLQQALNEVVARHEALRTTFENDRSQLRQIISPSLQLDLKSQPPLDLARGPLLRARLVRLAVQDHLLELAVHHIVSDGWSNAILLRDLCACYSALVEERPVRLPELSLQFADYAEWQQSRLTNNDFAAQRDYWREKLAGDLPGLDLPYQRQTIEGAQTGETRARLLPPALAEAAKSFAAREHASPFMLFFAIFQTLLHRYTGQIDFLVTTPSANRDRLEFESLIGPFANPLILRADLRDDPTLRELLGRTRTIALEAFANQDIPFEALLDEFQAARLQVNFHYDAGLQRTLELPAGLTSEFLPVASTGTVYELSASVLEEPHGLRLEIEYNPALFDPGTIERMLGHYETLLQSALGDATKPISKLELLTAEERSVRREPEASAPLDIRSALVERVLSKPDAVIARHGRRELSCAELLVRLESAEKEISDLDLAAAWIAHWRDRLETPPPPVSERSSSAAAAMMLRTSAGFSELERVASCSTGLAATEEIGAALLANVILIYPTPDLLADSATAFAAWLEAENITVACLPAAIWNRFTSAIAGRKARKPSKLRLAIVTEGNPNEGTFGRVASMDDPQIFRRVVIEGAGGTVFLNNRSLPENASCLHVTDLHSGEPLPIGISGQLVLDTEPTGELARRSPNESIERLGAISMQRYEGGFRVDLPQTEAVLCSAPGVRHALVRPVQGESESSFVAYLLSENGTAPEPSELRRLLRQQRQPNLVIPSAFVSLKDISIQPDGSLNLGALPSSQGGLSDTPEPVRPYLGLQLQLIAIWEEVLGVRGIGIRDDFFDLGGNSLLAMRMLQRAEIACGKIILPATLFRHPTIEHLAGEIAREARDESPTLLRVHDAGGRTPFFYLHGDLSGGGFYSLKLSRALGPEQPFYVLPPQDIRTLSAAPSIEEMAAEHLRALRAVRPQGPYVIGGFCIGGVVAYELAQQIKASGDTVERLLIIDASPDPTLRRMRWLAEKLGKILRWSDEEMVTAFGRWSVWRARIALRFAENRRPARRPSMRSISHRIGAAFGSFGRLFRSAPPTSTLETTNPLVEEERDLPSAFQWASASYHPKIYDGAVALLLSEDVLSDADNVSRRWQQLAPNVTVQPLRGSHLECITAHVEALAEKIEDCLEESPRPRGA